MVYNLKLNRDRVIGIPNPRMWGVFYEEINHAGDGGLYAELLRNRSFADACLPEGTVYANCSVYTKKGHKEPFSLEDDLPGWTLRCSYGAKAYMERTTENPRNPECPNQMMITVCKPATGVRAVNSGYWGIALKKMAYHGCIILRGKDIDCVEAGLMYKGGSVIVKQAFPVTEVFTKQEFTLESDVEDPDVRFFIEVKQTGTLWVDFVSLFPDDAVGVFRRDIFEKLYAMKPGFVRFPGGCVVEGTNMENAIHWKKTRGPIEDRPGHWDLWDYRASDGMGMKEFCDLAEAMDADLMYVFNCGMSCQARNSEPAEGEQFEWWVQNALDGIEYICGAADTKYGSLRAADGHPAPYRLKYLEIGNENYGEIYWDRYKRFYTLLKQKYPEITLIANSKVPDAPMDMIDDHYYKQPQIFPNMYGAYEGDDIPVYVGEYACNIEVGYGNLLSAISEACFMIRMENRCNRVRIASYAPLFCHENNRRWSVNLINFSNHAVYGIPSYDVQKAFAENTVSCVFAIEGANPSPEKLHITAGQRKEGTVVKIAHFDTSTELLHLNLGLDVNSAKCMLITSDSPADTNTAEIPHNVHPEYFELPVEDGIVSVELPPYSFIVLTAE